MAATAPADHGDATPAPNPRSRRKSDRRQQLLAAAERLFAERGFLAVRLEDIGAAAGVSGPAIYRHFPNKESLLVELLVGISTRLLAGAREVQSREADAAAALDGLIDFHLDFALGEPDLIRIQDRDLTYLPDAAEHRPRRLEEEDQQQYQRDESDNRRQHQQQNNPDDQNIFEEAGKRIAHASGRRGDGGTCASLHEVCRQRHQRAHHRRDDFALVAQRIGAARHNQRARGGPNDRMHDIADVIHAWYFIRQELQYHQDRQHPKHNRIAQDMELVLNRQQRHTIRRQ